MTVALYSFLGLCLLTMIGWLVLTRNTHALTSKRERDAREHVSAAAKENRKRTFVAFLKQWRSELSTFQSPSMGHGIFQAYQSKLPKLHAEVALVAGDFAGDQTFERLTERLSSLNQPDMAGQSKPQKDIILEAIDELIKHTNAA